MSSFCYLLRVMFSFSHEYIFLFLGAIKLNCLIILHTDTKVKILMGMSSCFWLSCLKLYSVFNFRTVLLKKYRVASQRPYTIL